MPYLEGLREALEYDLPDKIPERQMVTLIDDPGASQQKLQSVRDQVAKVKRQMFQERMVLFRGILTDAVAFMYSRIPFAPEELRDLAKEKLEDDAAVEHLMKVVEEAMADRLRASALGGHRDATRHLKIAPTKQPEAAQRQDVLSAPRMPVVPEARQPPERCAPQAAEAAPTDVSQDDLRPTDSLVWRAMPLVAILLLLTYLIVNCVRRRSASDPT